MNAVYILFFICYDERMKVEPNTYKQVKNLLKNYSSIELISINCFGCNKKIFKSKKKILVAIKHATRLFCSIKCCALEQTKLHTKMYNCSTCSKPVKRSTGELKKNKTGNVFCSKSCSATFSNTHRIRRKRIRKTNCSCGNKKYYLSKICDECRLKHMKDKATKDFEIKTFGDFKIRYENKSYAYYNAIRRDARRYAILFGWTKICKLCGYSNYVELCHIKAISSFPDDATMKEINSKSNVVYLCPNHHKEQELGLLKEKDKLKLKY